MNNLQVTSLPVRVWRHGHDTYEAKTRALLPALILAGKADVGSTLDVVIDPRDPRRVAVMHPTPPLTPENS
ncbi:hypothetical protein LZ198_15205 [Myxococcus sp. K15C18031901]|uniref:hypothetical protein n=1 Tax=Myxococcus dinghuensis TaxID=2906761 RepID=UPI0020A79210|nr:hypothetical protein [Myxococcus dinghuensis]MCP3100219.1 hypothetical protein [Myxococcus dinghuensis]